ncbi:MAG: hypothetical protein IV086_07700 [Hyphomonadaceae bacterium]|nr:MAG: hypothetical protein FD160_2453 [Caulobacteraceae bacterium]MBT9445563.1 hypothetical protein [Hyphomonadaceae bacterium]TPW06973.1 MAG: hypothetical protein FD124_1493 [Alphaproteobacteria bacterium]
MTTLTLEIPEEMAAWLAEEATRRGVSRETAALDLLEQIALDDLRAPLTEEDIAAIEQGLADMRAGNVFSSQEVWESLGIKE